VTAGTYGSASAIPFLTVDAKGRITSATSGTFSSTPPANSVTFNTLSTSATEADNVASRTAKAWVNFNGTGTVAIQASFNVSSITDHGTGAYTVNFTSALSDEKYTAAGILSFGNVSSLNIESVANNTAGSSKLTARQTDGAQVDPPFVGVMYFR
jgi:hypothetical protein